MGIAELFASKWFLFIYSGLLVVLTAIAIVRNQMSLAKDSVISFGPALSRRGGD